VDKESDQSSAASAISQALGKKQVPGEEALERIINSRSLPVKVQSRSLTSFVKDVGLLGIANMLQFYSVGHRVAILGAKGLSSNDFRPIYGEAITEGIKPEEFVRKFEFSIKPGSLLGHERADKITTAFELQKRGILSAQGLYRFLDDNFDFARNRDELLGEAKDKLLVAAATAAVTGKGPAGGRGKHQ